ncbi:MAG: type II toxin-antitoxin system VapC family toxin [Limisphaerales bacterium]
MKAYPDTSFLYSFYLKESNSPAAAAHAATMKEPLHVTELLAYEFRQSLRFQVWRRSARPREGVSAADARAALREFDADLASGVAVIMPCNLSDVLRRADELSRRHTMAHGYRGFDILHVATALHLGAKEFLSFDASQRRLAQAEGMNAKP